MSKYSKGSGTGPGVRACGAFAALTASTAYSQTIICNWIRKVPDRRGRRL